MKIKYKNNASYFPEKNFCVISDLHIGLEDKLIEQGISFPFNELKYLKKDLKQIINRFNPQKIIYNGDVLHKFGDIPPSVPKKLEEIIEVFNGEQIFLKGSHDTMLETILNNKGYELKNEYHTKKIAITHGNRIINEIKPIEYELLVLGHDHPSIEIQGEKKDCFLFQKNCIQNTNVLVQPSFSQLSEGVKVNDIKPEDLLSPYLKNCRIEEFKVIIETKNEVLEFPELGKFKKKL